MLPIPAPSAVCAFFGCVAMLAAALIASSPTTAMLGAGALLGLAAAFALTVPLGAQLRRQRLEFSWHLDRHEAGAASAGVWATAAFELRCHVHNRGPRALRFAELLPVLPAGVQLLSGADGELWLPARTRSEFGLRMRASAAGRMVLQGLAVAVPGPWGLFLAPLYFPSPLTIRVLPRRMAPSTTSNRAATTEADRRAGPTAVRQRGAGTELYELREHRAGDAFKTIAWKASARTGKLLVREVEREVQDALHIVLDVSASMRGGLPGERKLDHCIGLCATLARQAIERGERVGLITVDGRIVSRVGEAEGLPQMLRMYEALLDTTEVVDGDLTEVDDAAVVAIVGSYLRQQHGVELIARGGWDFRAITSHVERALRNESDRPASRIVASTPAHAALRRFCRVRGIALPYRGATHRSAKALGLAHALRTAVGTSRAPRTVLAVSDLDGVANSELLIGAAKLLMARQHRLAFVLPDAESFVPVPGTQVERDLRQVFGLEERSRRQAIEAEFGKLGVPVIPYAAQRGTAAVLRGLMSLRRVA